MARERTAAGRLEPSALAEIAAVYGLAANIADQLGDDALGLGVIAGQEQGLALGVIRAGGAGGRAGREGGRGPIPRSGRGSADG